VLVAEAKQLATPALSVPACMYGVNSS
jgi:hypothetical protein